MNRADDAHLWLAYDKAVESNDMTGAKQAADAIIRQHLPFFVKYAQETAFRQWDAPTREDYLAELLLVASERVSTYDRKLRHSGGRTASFVTYVKPYLKLARYRIEGSRSPMRIGHETVRLSAAASRFVSAELAAGRNEPSDDEIAQHLTERFGKRITSARVPKLRQLPQQIGLMLTDDSGEEYFRPEVGYMRPELEDDDPAEIVVREDEQYRAVSAVTDALAALEPTPAEMVVVRYRLMAEQPWPTDDVAAHIGVSVSEVRQMEARIRQALAQLLS